MYQKNYHNLIKDLGRLADPRKAKVLAGFFKCGKGEYGEGDKFLGIVVPEQRKIVRKYCAQITLPEIEKLVASQFHEHRLVGLLMLVEKFAQAEEKEKKRIFSFYLKKAKRVNNWDLVDLTAPKIVGAYLLDKERKVLYQLAKSKNMWETRIAILATFAFIREKQFEDVFKISEILLEDHEDLIHKAVGWMLREVGKRDQKTEEMFLQKHYSEMPRTMLRYAIEKFEEKKRQTYLKRK